MGGSQAGGETLTGDAGYPELLREGMKVARRLGMWVLYDLRDEPNLDYSIGYFRGRIGDFARRQERARLEPTKLHYRERGSYWRRAIHLAVRMGPSQHQQLAERMIQDIERDPELRQIPYVARSEVSPGRSHTCGKLSETPRRRPGKPRVDPLDPVDFRACESCGGQGFFCRTGSGGQR